MLTVSEAIATILAETVRLLPYRTPLLDALGLVLAEDAVSDLDSPPFDKALMDGYAVRSADLPDGRGRLRVVDEVMAGQVASRPVGPGEAIRIMTGAPLPAGADAVIPVEQTRLSPAERANAEVLIDSSTVSPGRNILRRGESARVGTRVLPAGRQLRPQDLGCLAELGNETIAVFPAPRVAVLATGDELVPIEQVPGPGQIRNSNEVMLAAQVRGAGALPVALGVARDDSAELQAKIAQGLHADVLLLTGGVSAGKLDLVPAALVAEGVRQVFHKVKVKPGQPIWFGVLDHPHRCYVFGLPGNPVSSMVCCELFVRTAIRKLMGIVPAEVPPLRAILKKDHFNGGTRPTYHPAKYEWTPEGAIVRCVRWIGSADLCATAEANGMALFPEGERLYAEGTVVDVFPW